MPRLFVGTLLDTNEQKRAQTLFAELKATAPDLFGDESRVKLTRAEKLHMTWLFIGNVAEESAVALNTALAKNTNWQGLRQMPAEINFDALEFWPDESHPALIVLTPKIAAREIFDGFEEIERIIKPFKSDAERFPFRPHITIARLKKGTVVKNVSKDVLKSYLPMVLKLTDIGLFESLSENQQTIYRLVRSYQL